MKGECGVTGCPNPAIAQCRMCGLALCKEHAISSPTGEEGVYFCRGCWSYLKARRGEAVFAGKGGLEYGDLDR